MSNLKVIENALVKKFGYAAKSKAAEHYNVSKQFISMMLCGKKPVPERILSDLGYKKVVTVTYEAIEKEEKQLDWVSSIS